MPNYRDISPSKHYHISDAITEHLMSEDCGFTKVKYLGRTSSWHRHLLLFWRDDEIGKADDDNDDDDDDDEMQL